MYLRTRLRHGLKHALSCINIQLTTPPQPSTKGLEEFLRSLKFVCVCACRVRSHLVSPAACTVTHPHRHNREHERQARGNDRDKHVKKTERKSKRPGLEISTFCSRSFSNLFILFYSTYYSTILEHFWKHSPESPHELCSVNLLI